MRRVAGALLRSVLVVVTLALSAILVPRLIGMQALSVLGGSMSGTYPTGSVVVAHAVEATEVEVGDVVLVERSTANGALTPVLHRVVERRLRDGSVSVRTKGDANPAPDPGELVLPTRVAIASFHVPYLGYLVELVRTPAGWVLAVVLPVTLLVAWLLVELWVVKPTRSREPPPIAWGTLVRA